MKRREFLGWIAAAAGAAAVVDLERLASPIIGAAWLADAEIVSLGLAGQREAVEAAVLLPAVLGHLASLEAALPASAELTARTAVLAGDLFLGYRAPIGARTRQRLGEAYRCFVMGESLGSPAVVTNSMNSRATLYDQSGDLASAVALQDEAVRRGVGTRANMACLLARRPSCGRRPATTPPPCTTWTAPSGRWMPRTTGGAATRDRPSSWADTAATSCPPLAGTVRPPTR